MSESKTSQLGFCIFGYMVLSASVVGYFVGLQSPMRTAVNPTAPPEATVAEEEDGIVLATAYADISNTLRSRHAASMPARFAKLNYEPSETTQPISQAAKQFALEHRQRNRAFNGAPPTIPHTIEQMSSVSCMACHREGIQTATLRAAKMSHKYYANCTQCHVESSAKDVSSVGFPQSEFEGLKAPEAGPRAFAGAPPQIPHSTWMRESCLSCHGFTSERGIRTTHPWQQNCTQCHAASSELDQVLIPAKPTFLKPPTVLP